MNNILILYNPYYQDNVIKEHLQILLNKGQVAFAKIKSKINDQNNSFEKDLDEIYASTSKNNPLQLFLSDYANLFVAKVIQVSKNLDDESLLPNYYKEKKLNIENYFIIEDLRELVCEDFTTIKNHYLSNFITPNYKNNSYAIYGNSYIYPLIIKQKNEIDYFLDESKHCLDIYKSQEYLKVQDIFKKYIFGNKLFNMLHPDSISNLICAEIEFDENKQNPLYDFTSIIVKYSKTLEYEIYDFCKKIFLQLYQKDESIKNISYSVQQRSYTLDDFFKHKPNIGTMKFLLIHRQIQNLLEIKCKNFIIYKLSKHINTLQDIRNAAVHEKIPSIEQTKKLRNLILGIDTFSVLKGILLQKQSLNNTQVL
ncbi:HP0729 family protein [Campylobacter sp.]|uniref:HP0729 family protein n=1 Tax=Campylobacter sp. TaxID=205 RepID=UPI0025BDA988|nr:HP0729 family protein [Campylobacter sp.]